VPEFVAFVEVRFAFGGSFVVVQVLRKTCTVFAIICKITMIASEAKKPPGIVLGEDEGESFGVVVG
jgi:hypothetical protein